MVTIFSALNDHLTAAVEGGETAFGKTPQGRASGVFFVLAKACL
jgi:hypothetical protein